MIVNFGDVAVKSGTCLVWRRVISGDLEAGLPVVGGRRYVPRHVPHKTGVKGSFAAPERLFLLCGVQLSIRSPSPAVYLQYRSRGSVTVPINKQDVRPFFVAQ